LATAVTALRVGASRHGRPGGGGKGALRKLTGRPRSCWRPFFATVAILGLAGHGLPRWLSYASAVLSLAFALGGAAALYCYGAFLGVLLGIVAVCVVAIAGEKLSAKAPEKLTLLG
jgi:hypothetical protein